MSDGAAAIYVALIAQAGAFLLWLVQKRKGRTDDDIAWQQRTVELSAEISHLWGDRLADKDAIIADKDAQLAARDRAIAERDAHIRQLQERGTHD